MENMKKILDEEIELIKPDDEILDKINEIADRFCFELKKKLKKNRIDAEVFVGGSLAKNTLVKKKVHDIDVFVRFNDKYADSEISKMLGKVLGKKFFERSVMKVHGSRDYYQLIEEDVMIEVIPVIKIKRPWEAVNITDLSYFHVNYILKKLKLNSKLSEEIMLAKTFAYACNCYGAESYIHGFSGYALELLISYYGSFLKFVKVIAKFNVSKKIIIDDAGFYKNKNDVLIELNESKLKSPIILIDPTFKERNALAGLNKESFVKFKKTCEDFLKKPSLEFFERKDAGEEFRKYEGKDLKIVSVKTNKQAGDIAGTKSKKFFEFFVSKLRKEFEINKREFEYDDEKNIAKFYFVLEKKDDEVIRGPPIIAVENLNKFKKVHSNAFIKKGFAYVKVRHRLLFEKWFEKFLIKEKKILKEMGIVEIQAY